MTPTIPIQSMTAAASMSLADATFRQRFRRRFRRRRDAANSLAWNDWFLTLVIIIIVGVGMVSSVLAMWTEQTMITYVAFGMVPLMVGPAVVVQRWKLQWMPSFRKELQCVREMVNDLAGHRLRLHHETQRLERDYHRMVDVEDRFREVVIQQGKSVDVYRALVKENASIQREVKKEQNLRELQDLFSILMNSDQNANGRVNRAEVERLIQRLQMFAAENGKFVDDEMIRHAFQKSTLKSGGYSQSAFSMFNVVQSALSDEEDHQPLDDNDRNRDLEEGFVILDMNNDANHHNQTSSSRKPKVTATGLVMAHSVEEGEGGLARPIRAENVRAGWVELPTVVTR